MFTCVAATDKVVVVDVCVGVLALVWNCSRGRETNSLLELRNMFFQRWKKKNLQQAVCVVH